MDKTDRFSAKATTEPGQYVRMPWERAMGQEFGGAISALLEGGGGQYPCFAGTTQQPAEEI